MFSCSACVGSKSLLTAEGLGPRDDHRSIDYNTTLALVLCSMSRDSRDPSWRFAARAMSDLQGVHGYIRPPMHKRIKIHGPMYTDYLGSTDQHAETRSANIVIHNPDTGIYIPMFRSRPLYSTKVTAKRKHLEFPRQAPSRTEVGFFRGAHINSYSSMLNFSLTVAVPVAQRGHI